MVYPQGRVFPGRNLAIAEADRVRAVLQTTARARPDRACENRVRPTERPVALPDQIRFLLGKVNK